MKKQLLKERFQQLAGIKSLYTEQMAGMDDNKIELEVPGYVHVDGYRYSPIFDFFRSFISVIVRESRI